MDKNRLENGYSRGKGIFLIVCLGVGVLFVFLWNAGPLVSQIPAGEKPPLTQEIFSKGEALYQKQCASCHGLIGAGDGRAAYLLYPKPRDFTRNEFRLISTSEMVPTDEDLFKTISLGMTGSSMPPWDSLSEKDRWALVYYVRYLTYLEEAKRDGKVTEEMIKQGVPWDIQKELASEKIDPASLIHVPPEPPATSESLARGKALFIQGCAPCHGPEGRGDGKQLMLDSLGLPLKPRDLTSGIFKGESTPEALYHRMVAGFPGTPMPSYKEAYTEEQIWDLIHFVKTLPKEGAGERLRLRRQQIVVKKIEGDLPIDPSAKEWETVPAVEVALAPLWWREDRIETVTVRALHNGNKMAFHLSWLDPTEDKSTAVPQLFSDGAALEFSFEKEPPFFGMGESPGSVHIWHWKASWQEEIKDWWDIEKIYPNTATDFYQADASYVFGRPFETRESKTEFHDPLYMSAWGAGNPLSYPGRKTALEEARAKGFGTYTTRRPERVRGEARGIWQEGTWQMVFHREMKVDGEGDIDFQPGDKLSIAFAVWDGATGDRDGQKSVSIWNELVVED